MCVERRGEVVVADKDYVPYAINDILHAMIRMCKAPYNDAYKIVQFSEYEDEELL